MIDQHLRPSNPRYHDVHAETKVRMMFGHTPQTQPIGRYDMATDRVILWPPEPPARWFALFRVYRINDSAGKLYLWRLRILECPLFGVMLHKIVAKDPDKEMHDHPFDFVSFVLWGGYEEWMRDRHRLYAKIVRWFNFKHAETPHKIACLMRVPTWTLVLRGPRRRTWGFTTDRGWVPWHVYLNIDGGSGSRTIKQHEQLPKK